MKEVQFKKKKKDPISPTSCAFLNVSGACIAMELTFRRWKVRGSPLSSFNDGRDTILICRRAMKSGGVFEGFGVIN